MIILTSRISKNIVGSLEYSLFRVVSVPVSPLTEGSLLQDKYVLNGDFITIMCGLKAGDPPISFNWMKDGDLATSLPGVKVVSQEFSSTLTILSTRSIHAGNYYCQASNPVSRSMIKTRVFIDGIIGVVFLQFKPLKIFMLKEIGCDIINTVFKNICRT